MTKVWYNENQLTVSSTIDQPTTLTIYNMLGKQISSQTIGNKKTTVNLNLPKGIYLASLGNNQSNTLKFVVN